MSRTKVFISYAHEDDSYRKQLVLHLDVLAREGLIDVWDDRKIEAGENWYERLHEQMLHARVAVILISPFFLTSNFILEQEVPKLFDAHETSGMRIYPLLIRSCNWQDVSWLAGMQLRPLDGEPVARRRGDGRDRVLSDVAREIATIVRENRMA